MRNHIRGFASTVLLAAASAGLSLPSAAQQIPQQLQPPANEQLLLQVHAKGDQIYTCKSDAAQFTWTLKAPDAQLFDKDGKFIAAWKQFGRPSGLWVDQNDMLYTVDSQSSADPKSQNYNGDCKMGIRIGSTKVGKVTAYIPPPPVSDPKLQPPEGIAVDSHGTIYAAAQQQSDVKKYVKN